MPAARSGAPTAPCRSLARAEQPGARRRIERGLQAGATRAARCRGLATCEPGCGPWLGGERDQPMRGRLDEAQPSPPGC